MFASGPAKSISALESPYENVISSPILMSLLANIATCGIGLPFERLILSIRLPPSQLHRNPQSVEIGLLWTDRVHVPSSPMIEEARNVSNVRSIDVET